MTKAVTRKDTAGKIADRWRLAPRDREEIRELGGGWGPWNVAAHYELEGDTIRVLGREVGRQYIRGLGARDALRAFASCKNARGLLAFTQRWGFLWMEDVRPSATQDVEWALLHAATIKTLTELQDALRSPQPGSAIRRALGDLLTEKLERGGGRHPRTQERHDLHRVILRFPLLGPPGTDVAELVIEEEAPAADADAALVRAARRAVEDLISAGLRRLGPTLRYAEPEGAYVLALEGTLLETLYLALARRFESYRQERRCAECGLLFRPRRKDQRYCPATPGTESRCALRARKRRERTKPTDKTVS